MALRSLLGSVIVLLVASIAVTAAEPPRKPHEKGKPAAAKRAAPPVHIQAVSPEAIAKELDKPTTMEFAETPLSDAVTYLRDLHKIPVVLDRKALEEVGVKPEQPVNANLRGLKLRSALNHILRDVDLAWTIRDEALVITSREQADATLETRVYEVADLVAARDDQPRPYNDFDQLIDVIACTVKPTSWDTVGGPGSISGFEATGVTVLVVSQTQEVHEAIEKLLADLRSAKRPGADTCPPIRKRDAASPQPQPPAKPGDKC